MTDFRDFERGAANQTMPRNNPWWDEDVKDKAHQLVEATVRALLMQSDSRQRKNLRHAKLYGNVDLAGFAPGKLLGQVAAPESNDIAPINIVKSCVDTISAKITKNRPKPMYVTSGGTWDQRQKAKLLNKFSQGIFYECRAHEMGKKVAKDAQLFGKGFAFVFVDNKGRVRCERVLPDEVLVDEDESVYGCPRQLYRVRSISREVLKSHFKSLKDEDIKNARLLTNDEGGDTSIVSDMVTLIEGWHLASGPVEDGEGNPIKHDGKRVVAISSATVTIEPYERETFPFAELPFRSAVIGYWPQGVVEDLVGTQLSLNKVHKRIQEAIRLGSTFRYLKRRGAKIPSGHLRNNVGDIVEVDNPADVTVQTPSVVSPELFRERQELIQQGYQQAGISALSATMQKPAGLNASVALETYNDIESERLVDFGQNYEQFYLDLARLCFDEVRELCKARDADEGEEQRELYKVKFPAKSFVEEVDWADINLDDDDYVTQAFPVSSLPSTPAARQQMVSEWVQQQWISTEEGRRLLDFPDLEQSTSLALSNWEDVEAVIDGALEKNESQTLEPMQDHELIFKRALQALLKAKREGYPEERLAKLRDVIGQAQSLLDEKDAAAAPPPGPAMPPGMPPGPGALPPGMPGPGALPPDMPAAPPVAA